MVVECRYCQYKNTVVPEDSIDGGVEYYVPCTYCGHKMCVQHPIKPQVASQPKASLQLTKGKVRRRKLTSRIPTEILGAGIVAMLLAVIGLALVITREGGSLSDFHPAPSDDSVNFDAAKAANDMVEQIASTPEGVEAIEYYGGKNVELTRFQKQFGISDRIAEAAIKEYVVTTGNLDYDLARVKTICLRNARNGIPYDYLPESEK